MIGSSNDAAIGYDKSGSTRMKLRYAAKHLRLPSAVLGALLIGCPAYGQGPGWTAASIVLEVVNTSNGGFNVRLWPELTGCVSQSGYGPAFASIYPNHPGLNRFKADMVAALVTGKRVALYLSDNQCQAVESRFFAD